MCDVARGSSAVFLEDMLVGSRLRNAGTGPARVYEWHLHRDADFSARAAGSLAPFFLFLRLVQYSDPHFLIHCA